VQPDVRRVQLTPADRFLLLACDGIWDVMTNQQVSPASAIASWSCHGSSSLQPRHPRSIYFRWLSLRHDLMRTCTMIQAVEFVNTRLDRGMAAGAICVELLDACLAKNPKEARGIGCDNMTANIVVFKK
jgi:protein phosphatase 1G